MAEKTEEKIEIIQDIKYPKQVASLLQSKNGEKKTLGINSELTSPKVENEKEKSMPLEMYASGLSRFVFTLIKKTDKNKEYVMANVPADEGYYIYEKTLLSMQEILASKRTVISEKDTLSPAYTERFSMGNFKGKTPAEVLLESAGNKEGLIKQGEFLNKNADKFPANKKMIAAIKDALNLLKNEKLENKSAPAPSNVITLYNEPMKPLLSNKNEKGNYLVYGIKILCDTSRNLPFSIEIMNCYAPVVKTDEGTLNPKMKEAEDIKKISMNISEKDWFKTINRVKKTLDNFETITYRNQAKLSEYAFWKNRTESESKQ